MVFLLKTVELPSQSTQFVLIGSHPQGRSAISTPQLFLSQGRPDMIKEQTRGTQTMKLFGEQSIYNWYRDIIRNPKYRWWIIVGSLAYILSPIDISPDLIPIVGQVDDVLILTLLVSEVSQLLIDRVKTMKGKETEPVASTDNPVDVNAVSVD
jgi:uncharacterized membrane protein YkvA (DUF1232 family)